jgi:H+/Cl- antiporter ClcA
MSIKPTARPISYIAIIAVAAFGAALGRAGFSRLVGTLGHD